MEWQNGKIIKRNDLAYFKNTQIGTRKIRSWIRKKEASRRSLKIIIRTEKIIVKIIKNWKSKSSSWRLVKENLSWIRRGEEKGLLLHNILNWKNTFYTYILFHIYIEIVYLIIYFSIKKYISIISILIQPKYVFTAL